MASFFAPRNKSTPSSSPTPRKTMRSSTTMLKTSAAIVVNQNLEVMVWANRPRSRESLEDPWRNTLMYYTFCDDKRFTNLDSLLTQLAPLSILHIASPENSNVEKATTAAARTKAQQVRKLLTTLQRMIETRPDLTGSENDDNEGLSAPAPTSLSEIHTKFPTVDAGRIEGCMMQLLLPSSQLSFKGNVQLASHPGLRKALGFWLHAEGLLAGGMPDDMLTRFQLQQGTMDSHLLLDRTAAECIHLLPPPNQGVATQVGGRPHNNSLLGILSQPARTKMGKRLIEQWLRQPLVNLKDIMYRQDAVHHLFEHGIERDQLRDEGLRGFASTDIGKLALHLGLYAAQGDSDGDDSEKQDMATGVGSTQKALQSLYQLYLLRAQKLPLLLDSLLHVVCPDGGDPSTIIPTDEDEQTMLQSLFINLQKASNELDRSKALVEAVLDLDAAPRDFWIKAEFLDELVDIRNELANVEASIETCHQQMNELWAESQGLSLDKEHVKLESSGEADTLAYQFRLIDTNATKVLQGELKDEVRVRQILKKGVIFSTKELEQLSDKKQNLMAEYDRMQRGVVADAMKIAATYESPLERTKELVAQLDALVSLAHVAAYSPHGYCRPTLTDGEEDGMGIKLKQARHPCLELQETVSEYIPNDVSLVFGESSFLLLTGPNMGGKSSYIRALGCIVTLAQIGSFVPCEEATINIVHHILCRVGAGDLQDRGISTFMAEMLEASSILKTATKRSLIVIDELGRGTSTNDGYGLARSISEYIVQQIGCSCVFATHFHELTQMEEENPSVKNFHVTAEKGAQGIVFGYQVQPGPCLESFGIHVAEQARLPPPVIADAKRKALELENFETKKQRVDNDADGGRLDFMTRFRNLPLKSFKTSEEKMVALRQLLVEEQ